MWDTAARRQAGDACVVARIWVSKRTDAYGLALAESHCGCFGEGGAYVPA
jgi:hypothetical protein